MQHPITDEQVERFWSKVKPFPALNACWMWTGKTHKGRGRYGEFSWQTQGVARYARAHRMSYELLVGPIPDGLTIDHLCRNTLCVNPDHLEPVTASENTKRGFPGRRAAPSVDGVRMCAHGHKVVGDNAMVVKGRRVPQCRACAYERVRRFKERRQAA